MRDWWVVRTVGLKLAEGEGNGLKRMTVPAAPILSDPHMVVMEVEREGRCLFGPLGGHECEVWWVVRGTAF